MKPAKVLYKVFVFLLAFFSTIGLILTNPEGAVWSIGTALFIALVVAAMFVREADEPEKERPDILPV